MALRDTLRSGISISAFTATLALAGGMVRMDLVTLVGNQNDKENPPKLQFRQRVVMPPDGFLRSFSAMENLVKQLIE